VGKAPGKELEMTEMKLADLKPDFYEVMLCEFLVDRTPRTRSADMAKCRRLAKEYLRKHPKSLPSAIEATEPRFDLNKVLRELEPPFLEWARKHIPDLLEKPAGFY
jgi:hypothetical protein